MKTGLNSMLDKKEPVTIMPYLSPANPEKRESGIMDDKTTEKEVESYPKLVGEFKSDKTQAEIRLWNDGHILLLKPCVEGMMVETFHKTDDTIAAHDYFKKGNPVRTEKKNG